MWLSTVVAMAMIVGPIAWRFQDSADVALPVERGERRLIGDAVPLFDGVSLAGWQTEFGTWRPAADKPVLVGKDGVAIRPLPPQARFGLAALKGGDRPPLYYRLDVLIGQQQRGDCAELHFGLSQAESSEPTRYVLRRDEHGVSLGTRVGDRGEFHPESRITPRKLNTDIELAIELVPHR
ncbi:MAG: hypothetical protein ACK5Q5_11375 [Planctomycetaceae bacterium]